MQNDRQTPGLSTRDILVTALLVAAFAVVFTYQLWGHWAVDFSAYYYAGYFYDAGEFAQIYAGPPQIIGPEMPDSWVAALAETGHANEHTYPFIYLPWVAAVMAPITRMIDPQVLMNAAILTNIALLMASMGLAWRIFAPRTTPLWLWSLISVALLATSATSVIPLAFGQVQILVYFLCLLAFERYRAGAFWFAGIALAIAAGLKITPAALILIFLWDRNWRALAGFALTCAIIAAFSLFVVGWDLNAQYFDLMKALNGQIFLAIIAFSVEGWIYQVWDLIQGTAPLHVTNEYIYPKPAWIDLIAKAFFLAGAAALWLTTRRLPDQDRMPRQLIGLSVLIPLAAPLGWVHYFLLTTLLLPGLLEHMNRTLAKLVIAGYFVALNALVMYSLIIQGLYFFPQIILCVPVLVALFGVIVLGLRQPETQAAAGQLRPIAAE